MGNQIEEVLMADPVFPVAVPIGQWTKVATASRGQIWEKKTTAKYFMTFRETGNPAPTLLDEGVKIFLGEDTVLEISDDSVIDVYLWCENNAGIVRVDL